MPIKRNEFLKPFSREHHHTLLLCWKIRTGIKKNIEESRIKKYSDWFYRTHLLPHFEMEEKYIFTIPGNKNKLVKTAVSQHRRLKRLFEAKTEVSKNLKLIDEELVNHVRFEERILFNVIQKAATDDQLKLIEINHSEEIFADNLADPFWE